MRLKVTLAVPFVLSFVLTSSAQQTLDPMIDQQLGSLLVTYKSLHAAPELSHYEEKTAALFAKELRGLGYTVTERVGKYAKPEWTSYGVVISLNIPALKTRAPAQLFGHGERGKDVTSGPSGGHQCTHRGETQVACCEMLRRMPRASRFISREDPP